MTANYVTASMLGGYVVAELDDAGQAARRYVYAGGRRLAKHESQWGNTVTWQHKNAMTESWVESGPERWAARAEMDPMGAAVGETAHPRPLPNEPPPSGLLGGMSYIPIEGSPTMEAELGMQLYVDRYIKQIYGGGAGAGQGGLADREHEQNRLGQLMAGERFLFGFDLMQARPPGQGGQYEEVYDYEWRERERSEKPPEKYLASVVRGYRRVPGARQQGGGGGQPQNSNFENDCQKFTRIVSELAAEYSSDTKAFVDAMLERFRWNSGAGTPGYNEFKSSGFKDKYTDNKPKYPGATDYSPNQVYHYVGTFHAGYEAGRVLGWEAGILTALPVVNAYDTSFESYRSGQGRGATFMRPLPPTPSQAADKRLNSVSVPHGALLGAGVIKPTDLAGFIRREVCQ